MQVLNIEKMAAICGGDTLPVAFNIYTPQEAATIRWINGMAANPNECMPCWLEVLKFTARAYATNALTSPY
jgi:hypothetical protein